MDPGIRRLAGRVLGGLALVFAIFFCARYCASPPEDPRRAPVKDGCASAGHATSSMAFATCVERAMEECPKDSATVKGCAEGIGKSLSERR